MLFLLCKINVKFRSLRLQELLCQALTLLMLRVSVSGQARHFVANARLHLPEAQFGRLAILPPVLFPFRNQPCQVVPQLLFCTLRSVALFSEPQVHFAQVSQGFVSHPRLRVLNSACELTLHLIAKLCIQTTCRALRLLFAVSYLAVMILDFLAQALATCRNSRELLPQPRFGTFQNTEEATMGLVELVGGLLHMPQGLCP
mmetsp:Transcript_14387/g.39257  ORF Transcript_14387/g.39257 Transcript_14387/m.39257 type:complete len:201 (-) Transcript_14387:1870-2472(-)